MNRGQPTIVPSGLDIWQESSKSSRDCWVLDSIRSADLLLHTRSNFLLRHIARGFHNLARLLIECNLMEFPKLDQRTLRGAFVAKSPLNFREAIPGHFIA